VLERFALVEIPAEAVTRIVERVTEVDGKPVALEPIRN
jgi:ATP-dependent RNA helicase DeaD